MARSVDELAAGFLSLGVGKGERVAMLARTRVEWTLCAWALISIGAPVVPVYPTSSALECAYILGNSGAPSTGLLGLERGVDAMIARGAMRLELGTSGAV